MRVWPARLCCHGGVRHVHINYHGQSRYYQATVLRLCKIYCCRDDGSDGKHMCSKAIRTIIRLL